MHILTGLLILVLVFSGIYYLNQRGFFQPILDVLSGLDNSYGTSTPVAAHLGEMRIRFVSLGSELSPSSVVLVAKLKNKEGITVTGWKLKTDLGTYVIPKAENRYSPSTPTAAPEDIYIRDGGLIRIYAGEGPNVRTAFGEWELHAGDDFLKIPHGMVTLLDEKGKQVDRYEY